MSNAFALFLVVYGVAVGVAAHVFALASSTISLAFLNVGIGVAMLGGNAVAAWVSKRERRRISD